ncbi:ABC transporter permease [Aminobacter sp. Piv2-1]|uniref:ABC transporter permease n=1 Tax=Aminobacter sp. Piv2-1 TaxID=3031122 RepID=UPI0030B75C4E
MLKLVTHRLLHSAILIFGVVSVIFFTNFVLGDPVRVLLPASTPQEAVEAFRAQMGFDRPILVQYLDYISGVLTGDFGLSWWQKADALTIAVRPLTATLELGLVAMLIASVFGITIGIAAAAKPDSWIDRLATSISIVGVSLPLIWFTLMLALVFSVFLGWLPTAGYGTWAHMVLPVVSLAALPLGRTVQITRAAMIDEMAKPYITTARARGLSERRIMFRHALRNALPPIVTEIGWESAVLLTGYTIIVESVFGWPGFGFASYHAILTRDMPVIGAMAFVAAVIVVIINILVDIAYVIINPTIRYE